MAFIPVTNCAEITMQYSVYDSDLAENVWGVQNTGAWTATSLAAVAAVFNTWNDTAVSGHSPYEARDSNTILVQTTARDLTTQTSPVVVVPYGGAHGAGGDTSGQIPQGITKAFTARSGLSGRSQRGRTFVVGLAADSLNAADKNLIAASTLADYVLWFDALIAAVHAANAAWTLVVISRAHNGAPRSPGITTPITSYGYANSFVDYQRRRAPGHARHH